MIRVNNVEISLEYKPRGTEGYILRMKQEQHSEYNDRT